MSLTQSAVWAKQKKEGIAIVVLQLNWDIISGDPQSRRGGGKRRRRGVKWKGQLNNPENGQTMAKVSPPLKRKIKWIRGN